MLNLALNQQKFLLLKLVRKKLKEEIDKNLFKISFPKNTLVFSPEVVYKKSIDEIQN